MHTAQVTARFEHIKTEGKEIAKLMKDTIDNVKPDKKSAQWLAYVDYVNGLVVEGITNGIDSSMTFVAEQVLISCRLIIVAVIVMALAARVAPGAISLEGTTSSED